MKECKESEVRDLTFAYVVAIVAGLFFLAMIPFRKSRNVQLIAAAVAVVASVMVLAAFLTAGCRSRCASNKEWGACGKTCTPRCENPMEKYDCVKKRCVSKDAPLGVFSGVPDFPMPDLPPWRMVRTGTHIDDVSRERLEEICANAWRSKNAGVVPKLVGGLLCVDSARVPETVYALSVVQLEPAIQWRGDLVIPVEVSNPPAAQDKWSQMKMYAAVLEVSPVTGGEVANPDTPQPSVVDLNTTASFAFAGVPTSRHWRLWVYVINTVTKNVVAYTHAGSDVFVVEEPYREETEDAQLQIDAQMGAVECAGVSGRVPVQTGSNGLTVAMLPFKTVAVGAAQQFRGGNAEVWKLRALRIRCGNKAVPPTATYARTFVDFTTVWPVGPQVAYAMAFYKGNTWEQSVGRTQYKLLLPPANLTMRGRVGQKTLPAPDVGVVVQVQVMGTDTVPSRCVLKFKWGTQKEFVPLELPPPVWADARTTVLLPAVTGPTELAAELWDGSRVVMRTSCFVFAWNTDSVPKVPSPEVRHGLVPHTEPQSITGEQNRKYAFLVSDGGEFALSAKTLSPLVVVSFSVAWANAHQAQPYNHVYVLVLTAAYGLRKHAEFKPVHPGSHSTVFRFELDEGSYTVVVVPFVRKSGVDECGDTFASCAAARGEASVHQLDVRQTVQMCAALPDVGMELGHTLGRRKDPVTHEIGSTQCNPFVDPVLEENPENLVLAAQALEEARKKWAMTCTLGLTPDGFAGCRPGIDCGTTDSVYKDHAVKMLENEIGNHPPCVRVPSDAAGARRHWTAVPEASPWLFSVYRHVTAEDCSVGKHLRLEADCRGSVVPRPAAVGGPADLYRPEPGEQADFRTDKSKTPSVEEYLTKTVERAEEAYPGLFHRANGFDEHAVVFDMANACDPANIKEDMAPVEKTLRCDTAPNKCSDWELHTRDDGSMFASMSAKIFPRIGPMQPPYKNVVFADNNTENTPNDRLACTKT